MDMIKGIILTLVLGTPLLLGTLWIMASSLLTGGSMHGLFNGFSNCSYVAIQLLLPLLFNKFSPLEEGKLKTKSWDFLKEQTLKAKAFLSWMLQKKLPGNAYFTGFGKNKRIVFFDNLIKTLEADEVEAVLAMS